MAHPNRREFLKGLAAAPLMLQTPALPTAGSLLFLGTQTQTGTSKGIYAFRWDPTTGTLAEPELAAAVTQPTYLTLSPDRRFLFAANETDEWMGGKGGGVSSYRIAARAAAPGATLLEPLGSVPSGGGGTCHVGVDPTGQTLLCANYNGGSASSFHIAPNGHLSAAVSHFQYTGHGPNPDRQDAPHVHRATISPGGHYALFNDLGLDCIHIYRLHPATAQLTPHTPAAWSSTPGAGPRALRFHPNGRWAYCVAELSSSVFVLHWDESRGTLTTVQEISLKPEGFTGRAQASDIVLDRDGRFAYAACRFYDVLVTFAVSPEDGRLKLLARAGTGGKIARDIALDPSKRWLLSANEGSDTISIFARDPETGLLAESAATVPASKPQCLRFL